MPAGWSSYLILIFGSTVTLGLALSALYASRYALRDDTQKSADRPINVTAASTEDAIWKRRVAIRSSLAVSLSTGFVVLGLFLIPLSQTVREKGMAALVVFLFFSLIVSLGIAYAIRKRDLFWKGEI